MEKIKVFIISLFMVIIVVPICSAKNLFVATNGSDSTSYYENDIDHPWRSVSKAWADARTGDIVYYREGDYTINSPINIANGGHSVTHINYNNETVSWSSTLSDSTIEVGEPNTTIDGINVNSAASGGDDAFFRIGWNINRSSPSGFTLRNCIGRSSAAGQNTGIVHARPAGGEWAENALIENCRFIGPGSELGTINSSGIIMFQARNWIIRNCEISGFNTGIYYNKHCNNKNSRNGEISNTYVHDCHAALRTSGNYIHIFNNIFDGNIRLGYDAGTNANGIVGSDNNLFEHNTITGSLVINHSTRGGDDLPGGQYNEFLNNIFFSRVDIFPYNSGTHNTTGDFNLYMSNDAVLNNRIRYTVSEWRNRNGSDSNSIAGMPSFIGGSNPNNIEGFALNSGSIGKNGASNGRDMGANVDLVGFSSLPTNPGSGGDSNSAPATPAVSYVESSDDLLHDSNIIFKDNFEGSASMHSKYFSYNDHNGDFVVANNVGVGGSKGLSSHWEQGQVDAGSFWYMFGRNPITSLSHTSSSFNNIYWRFYLRTSEGWTGGNPAKLTRATVFSSPNWSQAMIAHVWGNLGEDVIKMDPVSCVFNGQVQSNGYNDHSAMQWLGAKVGQTPVYSEERSNSWQYIEVHVKLNTLGESDGVFEVWVNDNLESEQQDLNFRGTWSEYEINGIAFGNWWNNGAQASQNRYIDNLVISTNPIGPSPSPVNPVIHKTAFSDIDSNDEQSRFHVQIYSGANGNGLVWEGEKISDDENTIRVDNISGSFEGVLSGRSSLQRGTSYYARVRQADNSGAYSDWSDLMMFRTESDPAQSTLSSPRSVRIVEE